ncbi:MAG: AAA family ATPase [Candidatus Saccharibacteria bacterium]|nr:AAA family ATPase [Candidatus Saccharibacteria bacterium]
MKRVAIIGAPGSGKSTFARELAEKTGLPLIHLDFYYHQTDKNYYENKEAWFARVKKIIARDEWIMDGNYSTTIPERLARADIIIYFDLPRWLTMYRVLKRRVEFGGQKKRQDMPDDWREKLDWAFLKHVWNHKKRSTTVQKIEKSMNDKNKSQKIMHFTSSRQAQNYLKQLQRADNFRIGRQ